MGCCCSCLNSCCCTEAGLRCHTVVSICGFFYFALMFLLFERQKHFFQFHMPNEDGTKWSLLAVAGIWLFLFFLCLAQLNRVTSNKVPTDQKTRITVFDVKSSREANAQGQRNEGDTPEMKSQEAPFLRDAS